MEIPNFYLEPATFELDFEVLHQIRTKVFVLEQQILPEVEFDQLDRHCQHVIARAADCTPIGTGRLSPEGNIGRLAVLQAWRGQGVGASILRTLIDNARHLGLTKVTVKAQLSALGFYQKFGFTQAGAAFISAGIPHQALVLNLQVSNKVQVSPKSREAAVPAQRFDSIAAALSATLQQIKQTRRQLYIYSRDLDFALYGQNEVVEAIKQFVLHTRNANVQIIIQEPGNLRGQAHPLLELAQRVSSYFLIRTPLEAEDLQYASAFSLNDGDSYLFRMQGNRFQGHWSPKLPAINRQLREEFERVWQRSRPCTEFRALNL